MAKKNLSALMQGIMGEADENTKPAEKTEVVVEEEKPALSPETTPAPAEDETPAFDDLEEKVDEEFTDAPEDEERPARRRSVGRPPKGTKREKSDEVRATFIVDPELLRKVKYISFAEECLMKEVVDRALWDYIKSWEESNGKIRLPRKRK
ncbi:MAG: hypothetical protein NC328_05380 [Muribaculum sp.]|nr:hypothetical protein [Muribaculum sp.]